MPKIKPFRAVIYNQEKIKDLSSVVCPPYDIISATRQEYYHNICPYNFIHIILGKDIPQDNKYKRAKSYFKDWLKSKILIQDESPAMYFYSQQYNLKGEKKSRLGFIALLSLEEGRTSIFGHEHTRLEPKEDRLRLLKNVKANLSPIFVVFSDHKRIIQRTYQQHIQAQEPFIDIIDDDKTSHKLWRLNSGDILGKIQADMQGANIFIADGHHRYEVACAYRDEMKRKLGTIAQEAGYNYILAYFTSIESRGLTILPIHRFVKIETDLNSLSLSLKDYFDIEEIKDKIRFFFLMEKAGQRTEHVLGMYKDKKYWLLRLKNIKILDRIISDKPREYRTLDVSILNYIILKKILSLDLEDKETITFSPHPDELIEQVNNNNSYIAFFLNPVKIQQITAIATSGEKMPAKSTYFYPKVASGLLIHKFE